MQIAKTTEYKIFKKIATNRELDKFHLFNLTKAIIKKNLLAENPIIVNSKMEVIDGQHRLEVAKNNNLEVYYIVSDQVMEEDIRLLNTVNRNWHLTDYLDSYIKQQKPGYLYLKDYTEKTGLSLSNAMLILGGMKQTNLRDNYATVGLRTLFKMGDFKVTQSKLGEQIAEIITDLMALCQTNEHNDREFIRAVINIFSSQDNPDKIFTEIFKNAARSGIKINRRANITEYLRQLEDLHNFGKHDEGKIRLY